MAHLRSGVAYCIHDDVQGNKLVGIQLLALLRSALCLRRLVVALLL